MAKTFPDKHLHSLQSLLDDESSSVREAVLAELIRLGPLAVEWLQALAAEESPELASHARHFLREMHCEDPVERFRDFIGAFNYELETGFLLLSSALDPKLEPSDCCLFLDRMADRVQQLTIEPASPVQMCRTLNRVMFHEYGFAGARNDFYHPDNSCSIGCWSGAAASPSPCPSFIFWSRSAAGFRWNRWVCPDVFIVGCFQEDLPFYIDVYDKGVSARWSSWRSC